MSGLPLRRSVSGPGRAQRAHGKKGVATSSSAHSSICSPRLVVPSVPASASGVAQRTRRATVGKVACACSRVRNCRIPFLRFSPSSSQPQLWLTSCKVCCGMATRLDKAAGARKCILICGAGARRMKRRLVGVKSQVCFCCHHLDQVCRQKKA